MNLSQYFKLEEFEFSDTAKAKGINNSIPKDLIPNVIRLHDNVLYPLRKLVGCPVRITSGYRCAELNKAVGGANNSGHLTGRCADIHVNGMTAKELYNFIKKSGVKYRQCILESNSWVHIDYKKDDLKCENLIYDGKSYVLDK